MGTSGRGGEQKDLKDASTTTPVRTLEAEILSLANESKQLSLPSGDYVELLAARLIPEENAVVGIVSNSQEKELYYNKWDLKSGQCKTIFKCKSDGLRYDCQAIFLPSSELFILNSEKDITLIDPRKESNQSDNAYELRQGELVLCVGIMPEAGWLIGVTQMHPKNRQVVLWDLTTRKQLITYHERDRPGMLRGMLEDYRIMIRTLSNQRIAISTQDDTEVWELSNLSNPKVTHLPGCFLRETEKGVLTWKVRHTDIFTMQLFNFRGDLLNLCTLFIQNIYTSVGLIDVPCIVSLPDDQVLLILSREFGTYSSLMHFNSHLELMRQSKSSSLHNKALSHPNLHSLFEPSETSPYLPLMCDVRGMVLGPALEYCKAYQQCLETVGPLIFSVTNAPRPVARIILSYLAGEVDVIARLLYPIEPPVEIKKEEMQAFIKQLLPLLQNPKFSTGDRRGLFQSQCTDSLRKELDAILQKTEKTEDQTLLQNLYTQVVNAINSFMKDQKSNPAILEAFKKILQHDHFLKSTGAGIPDQISLVTIKKISDFIKKAEYKP